MSRLRSTRAVSGDGSAAWTGHREVRIVGGDRRGRGQGRGRAVGGIGVHLGLDVGEELAGIGKRLVADVAAGEDIAAFDLGVQKLRHFVVAALRDILDDGLVGRRVAAQLGELVAHVARHVLDAVHRVDGAGDPELRGGDVLLVGVQLVDVAPQVDRLAHVAAERAVDGPLLAGRGLLAVLGHPGLDRQILV